VDPDSDPQHCTEQREDMDCKEIGTAQKSQWEDRRNERGKCGKNRSIERREGGNTSSKKREKGGRKRSIKRKKGEGNLP
jgi:hypothetical protein